MQYVLRRNDDDEDDDNKDDDDDDDDGGGGGGGGDGDEIIISVSKVFILTSKKLVGNTFVCNMKHLAQTYQHFFFTYSDRYCMLFKKDKEQFKARKHRNVRQQPSINVRKLLQLHSAS